MESSAHARSRHKSGHSTGRSTHASSAFTLGSHRLSAWALAHPHDGGENAPFGIAPASRGSMRLDGTAGCRRDGASTPHAIRWRQPAPSRAAETCQAGGIVMVATLTRVKIAPKGMGLNDFVAMQEGY